MLYNIMLAMHNLFFQFLEIFPLYQLKIIYVLDISWAW